MIQLLLDNPLLLLFIVAAIGYPLGHIKIAGSSLGVAAVLFVGLAFGALHPEMKIPALIYELGLVIFVYAVGLASARAFVSSLGRKGLRDNLLVVGILIFAAVLALVIGRAFGLSGALTAGTYAGSLTNTPALAGVLEAIRNTAPPSLRETLLTEPVVAYSITYPVGVIGMILAIAILRRMWGVNFAREARESRLPGVGQRLENVTVRVTRPTATGQPIATLLERRGWDVLIGRVRRGNDTFLADGQTQLQLGDHVIVIGPAEDVAAATALLGERSDANLQADRSAFDYRRVFVSRPEIAGRRLRDLKLREQFDAFVTRVRRGDSDVLAHGDTILELGDRVRVVAPPQQMPRLTAFFGDSYRAISEIDILTFNLGLALGTLVGMIPIPLPGGVVIRLGFAGGPLVVALVLGALERTGPLVWNIPYSANMMLRQIGLILFLAGVGTRSGYAFVTTMQDGGGLAIFAAGTIITVTTAVLTLVIGYKLLKIPMSLLTGMLSGLQTQPAVLGFALQETRNELPNIGYAAVFPVALITKIICAQLLLSLMS